MNYFHFVNHPIRCRLLRVVTALILVAPCLSSCASETTTLTSDGGGGTQPVDLAGTWTGAWFIDSFTGYISLSLTRQTDLLAGKASIGGFACIPDGEVTGRVTPDSVFITVFSDGDSIFVAASRTGESLQGLISGSPSGACAGVSGAFSARKGGTFVATTASGIQFIPDIYSTAYPMRAHMIAKGGSVFWYEGQTKSLRMAPATGGPAKTLSSDFTSDFAPIATDGNNVYVADSWTIKKVPVGGGPADSLAQANFYIWDVATDGAYVYWIDNEPLANVERVPVGGGAKEKLGAGDKAGRMRLAGGWVYWTSHDDTILRVPAGGGAVETLAGGLPFLSDIACDGEFVFFSEQDTGRIRKVAAGGGGATLVVSGSALWSPYVLAVDHASLFWTNQEEVAYVSKSGGEQKMIANLLATLPFFPEAIAVDGNVVYWTEIVNGAIRAAELPAMN